MATIAVILMTAGVLETLMPSMFAKLFALRYETGTWEKYVKPMRYMGMAQVVIGLFINLYFLAPQT